MVAGCTCGWVCNNGGCGEGGQWVVVVVVGSNQCVVWIGYSETNEGLSSGLVT